MSFRFFLIFVAILLIPSLKPLELYSLQHTEISIVGLNNSTAPNQVCAPEVNLKVEKLGIENVVSSCLIYKFPLKATCSSIKVFGGGLVKLDSTCIEKRDYEEPVWVISLYSKHTPFSISKIVLINRTLECEHGT